MTPGQTNIFVSMNISFVLSLCLSKISDPETRKWFSTCIGIFFGFYAHGLAYWRTMLSVTVPFVCMYVFSEDRKRARTYAVAFATAMMIYSNFLPWWTINRIEKSCQTAHIWMRTIGVFNQYCDAEHLPGQSKGKSSEKYALMTPRERKYALYLTERPGIDWFHYNFFLPTTFMGPYLEYGLFYDFIHMQGDIAQMRPSSNIMPAL